MRWVKLTTTVELLHFFTLHFQPRASRTDVNWIMTSNKKVAELVSFLCCEMYLIRQLTDAWRRPRASKSFHPFFAAHCRQILWLFHLISLLRDNKKWGFVLELTLTLILKYFLPPPELWDNSRWKKKSGKKERKQRGREKNGKMSKLSRRVLRFLMRLTYISA